MLAASTTAAYHKQTAKRIIGTIVDNLNLLLSSRPLPLGRQIGIWADLARNYNNEELARSVVALANAASIDEQFAGGAPSNPPDILDATCRLQANEILGRIVIPFLISEAQ